MFNPLRLFSFFNLTLFFLICIGLFFIFFSSSTPDLEIYSPPIQRSLPKNTFDLTDSSLEECAGFQLKWVQPGMQLPKLSQEIAYLGKNLRPDAKKESLLYLGLKSSEESQVVKENKRIYLNYESLSTKGKEPLTLKKGIYHFSQNNRPSPLWLVVRSTCDQEIEVTVHMQDENQMPVKSPEENRLFCLTVAPHKPMRSNWQLGDYKVDPTLLIRQRACWMGPDRFLECHGGEEYAYTIDREKIEFLEGESLYACFVKAGDFLIWKDQKWQSLSPHDTSQSYPILVVNKIEDKLMLFEIWDLEGREKTNLSLLKTRESHVFTIQDHLKFVGAKTWSQFIVETPSNERFILKLKDWLVLTPEGWRKLDKADVLDEYVNGKLKGPLFVLEQLIKENGRQLLAGHLFNTSRTEIEEVKLEAIPPPTPLVKFYQNPPPLEAE